MVGADAVLVVDSHFNGEMGRQIIAAVRQVTDKPIRYLVNTNAFGDHIFGNYVFPKDTRIVANRRIVGVLRGLTALEVGRRMAASVGNDLTVFDGVELRLPDETFEDEWSVDLDGQVVHVRYFGSGMSANDPWSTCPTRGSPGPRTWSWGPARFRGRTSAALPLTGRRWRGWRARSQSRRLCQATGP